MSHKVVLVLDILTSVFQTVFGGLTLEFFEHAGWMRNKPKPRDAHPVPKFIVHWSARATVGPVLRTAVYRDSFESHCRPLVFPPHRPHERGAESDALGIILFREDLPVSPRAGSWKRAPIVCGKLNN